MAICYNEKKWNYISAIPFTEFMCIDYQKNIFEREQHKYVKEKKYLIKSSIIMFLLTSLLFLVSCGINEPAKLSKPYFLNYNGAYYGYISESSAINFIFIASDTSEILFNKDKIVDVEIVGTEALAVDSWNITKGDKYKDAYICNLTTTLKNSKIESGTFNKIRVFFTDKSVDYNIGSWQYQIFNANHENYLSLVSNSGMSQSIDKYLFSVKNISKEAVTINQSDIINSETLESVSVKVDNTISTSNDTEVLPGQTADIIFEYKNNADKYDLYYYSAKIIYKINGNEYVFITPGSLMGFPLGEKTMENIYKRFIDLN